MNKVNIEKSSLSLSLSAKGLKGSIYIIFHFAILLLLVAFSAVGFSSCSNDKLKADRVELKLEINSETRNVNEATAVNLFVKDEFKIKATVYPETLVNKNVVYSSVSDIVSIDKQGNVEVLKAGKATISVKSVFGGKEATFSINAYNHVKNAWFSNNQFTKTLTEQESVKYDNKTHYVSKVLELEVGDYHNLRYATQPDSWINAKDCYIALEGVSYLSEAENIITVNNSGTVRAKKTGDAYCILELTEGDNKFYDICKISVVPTAVSGISINKTSLSIQIGSTEP